MKKQSNLATAWGGIDLEAHGETTTVMTFDDDYKIVRINTVDEALVEGQKVQHCFQYMDVPLMMDMRYDQMINNPYYGILFYSLRSPQNTPHVTFVIDHRSNTLMQARGKQNRPAHPKYMPYVLAVIEECGLTLSDNCGDTGLLFQDGEYHQIMDLPNGFHCQGNFDISNNRTVRPKNLPAFIDGDLNISNTRVYDLDAVQTVMGKVVVPSYQERPRSPLGGPRIFYAKEAVSLDIAKAYMRKWHSDMLRKGKIDLAP